MGCWEGALDLSGVVRVGLTEEVISEQRPEGGEEVNQEDSWDRYSRQQGQPVQRPCGRSLLCVFLEPYRGQLGGEVGEGEGHQGGLEVKSCKALRAAGRTVVLFWE